MSVTTDSLITRRGLLRLGALTGLATAFSPALHLNEARAQNVTACNAMRPTTPAAALDALLQGNARWSTFDQIHPGEDEARRTCVAENPQTPFAAIVSCSDSRVPPELVFDQGLGDLFVARVAGNVATSTLIESLLFGTGNLGALVLLVLGHSICGAVRVAVTNFPAHSLQFVREIFPAVKLARAMVRKAGGNPNDPTQVIPVATDQNVILHAATIRKQKPFKDFIKAGTLIVVAGRYDLDTQLVTILSQ